MKVSATQEREAEARRRGGADEGRVAVNVGPRRPWGWIGMGGWPARRRSQSPLCCIAAGSDAMRGAVWCVRFSAENHKPLILRRLCWSKSAAAEKALFSSRHYQPLPLRAYFPIFVLVLFWHHGHLRRGVYFFYFLLLLFSFFSSQSTAAQKSDDDDAAHALHAT